MNLTQKIICASQGDANLKVLGTYKTIRLTYYVIQFNNECLLTRTLEPEELLSDFYPCRVFELDKMLTIEIMQGENAEDLQQHAESLQETINRTAQYVAETHNDLLKRYTLLKQNLLRKWGVDNE